MNYWKKPHISKVYEAITSIADNRIELTAGNTAKCYSSSGGKFYEIKYDPSTNSIMSNDNSAYYTGTLSYPMIAYFMLINKIPYKKSLLDDLKEIKWKDINQKYKNNYDKAIEDVLISLKKEGKNIENIKKLISEVYVIVSDMKIKQLGGLKPPPQGY